MEIFIEFSLFGLLLISSIEAENAVMRSFHRSLPLVVEKLMEPESSKAYI